MTPLLKTTALTVDYDQDQRSLQARGAISMLVQPALNRINQRLAEEKPALVREGDIVASTWLPPIPSGPFKRLVLSEAKIAIGRFVPQTVSIEVTRACGCACDHCVIKEGDGELKAEEIKRVVDEALDLGACIITFTEGDPLLRDDIFELISHVDPERAVVNMFTPGLEMTPDKAEMLKDAGLYNILIGVYSTDPEVHDRIRGLPGAHEKAVAAIKMALDAGLLVTMSTHVKGDRVSEIFDLYDLATELGVHEFSIWEGMPKSAEEQLTKIDRETITRFYRKVNRTPGGPRVFASTYFEGQMLGCMAGRRWIHVGVDGGVRPCPYIEDAVGNVLERSLKDIWKDVRKSGEFEAFRTDCPAQSQHLAL
ncbi:radical SAM/SPASM domain-containing protein [Methanocrinis sp.]|uniref:radical SAM/SPASM domain-containing protein n=1 Tax=Methanocrinis sp. TaxID=3101522 RepID=UPI003D0A0868